MQPLARTLPLLAIVSLTACDTGEMGVFEALDALQEVHLSSRGEQATSDVIEVSTDFTIGAALEDAAQTVADFWESQADCTTVTLEGSTLIVDYGALQDACLWQGRSYAGVNTVTVQSTTAGALEVVHGWNGFTNGEVQVDGSATVTWDGTDQSRRVQTEHTWSDDQGHTVDVVGDHLTAPIEVGVPFWESGFTLEGTRDWTSESGDWTLEMEDLELRLLDPAPQAGTIRLVSPRNKTLAIAYQRLDETTIQAVLSGIRGGDRVYHINPLGGVDEADGSAASDGATTTATR